MLILLFFAFLSGLVTILAPCIWPLLPIILSATVTGGKHKPLGITLGIIISFATITLSLSYLVRLFHFDPNILRLLAVVVIGFMGLSLIVPQISAKLEGYLSKLNFPVKNNSGFIGGLITGLTLGIVWSPCAGPILATIATLGATTSVNIEVVLVTIFYVVGLGIPLFFFAKSGRVLNKYTGKIQQVFGVIMILLAIGIYTNYDKVVQAKLLDAIPSYSNFLVTLEGNETVQKELNKLKGDTRTIDKVGKPMNSISQSGLPNLGRAPEFTGITKWLNSEPLTLVGLRGKVVLVDFWTYTCINCIRTLPHVVAWDQKYKDKGLVIIGVHTPEFEFEKTTSNVENAINQFGIKYPVAQDNDYATWEAYGNHYWPAKYLIDQNGVIRYTHFGEGEYDTTEMAIQQLLSETGTKIDQLADQMPDQTPTQRLSLETYLGSARASGAAKQIGTWTVSEEYITSGTGAALEYNFYASKVFLVMRAGSSTAKVKIILDGKDLKTIIVDTDKLYQLVDLPQVGDHLLRLEFLTPGTQAYAFTFG